MPLSPIRPAEQSSRDRHSIRVGTNSPSKSRYNTAVAPGRLFISERSIPDPQPGGENHGQSHDAQEAEEFLVVCWTFHKEMNVGLVRDSDWIESVIGVCRCEWGKQSLVDGSWRDRWLAFHRAFVRLVNRAVDIEEKYIALVFGRDMDLASDRPSSKATEQELAVSGPY